MLLRRGEDEDRVRRWLFQRFQKRIEGRLGQHVHLINDINLVVALLRRYTHLVNNGTDVLDLVVRGRIQFKHIEGIIILLVGIESIDGPSKDSRRSGLSHTAWPTKEVSLGNLVLVNGLLQRLRDAVLSHHRIPVLRSVLPCRHGKLRLLSGFHWSCEYRTHSNASPNRFMNRFPTEKALVFKVLLCTFAPH